MQKLKTIYQKNPSSISNKGAYEVCVLCSHQTDAKRSTHIDLRAYYVKGCGQLCCFCWKKIKS